MSITKIKGSQIAQSTDATISALRFLNTSGNAIFQFPVGTTAQRPAGASDAPAVGGRVQPGTQGINPR